MTRKKETVKEVAVSFVRRIRLEEKTCLVCGSKFIGPKKNLYCGRACQNKAHYERHAKEYRQARMEKYHAEKKVASKK